MNALQERLIAFLRDGIRTSETIIDQYEQGVARFHVGNEDKTSEALTRERAKVEEAKQLIAAWSSEN
jgi:hypothetical protein